VLDVNGAPAVFRNWAEEGDKALLDVFWHAALFPDVGVATAPADFQRVCQRFNPSAWALEWERLLSDDSHPAAPY
jgi:hypothetical protein